MQKLLKREPRPRELVWVARGSGVGILLIALFIAIRLSSIQSAWHLSLLFGSGLGVMLILRWLWYRINVYSELAAVVVSLGLSPILLFGFKDMPEGARLLWMVVISTIAVVATTLLTRPEADATLKRFFKQARPMGWWGPVARKVGVDPAQSRRAFFRAAGAVALACVTLFGLKIGTGILMLQTPHGLAIAGPCLAIALGLAVVPLWLRLGFKDFSPSQTKRVIN